jgi:hypothetical protein
MIELQEREEIEPLCPHCEEPVRLLLFRALRGFAGKRYLYFCSACRKTLGVSHRKGFWMG